MRRFLLLVTLAGCSTAPVHQPTPVPVPVPVRDPVPDLRSDHLDLAFAGDVMFGRYSKKKGFRPIPAEKHDVFQKVAGILDSDFTMVNLETPILRKPPKQSPYGNNKRFVATPKRVARMRGANIDAVTLANNHAYDMHRDGVVETPEILDELGIRYVGAHRDDPPILRVETVEVQGWKIGFIAATTVRNGAQHEGEPELPYAEWKDLKKTVTPLVEEARADHDLVIVVLHWGTELVDEPDSWQVRAAHAFIDAGADAVIGSHPHVLQGIERYKNGVIAYSLGNFLFDNLRDTVRYHGVLHLEFEKQGSCLGRAVFHPTVGSHPYFRPEPARGRIFDIVGDRLQKLSGAKPLGTAWQVDGDTLVASGACTATAAPAADPSPTAAR